MNFEIIKIPQPFFEPTNVIRIEDTIIDAGHVGELSTNALAEQLERGSLQDVKEVIITHPHIDHVGVSVALARLAEKPHIVFRGSEWIIQHFTEYTLQVRDEQERLLAGVNPTVGKALWEFFKIYFPLDQEYERVNISRAVEAEDEINMGDIALRVIHTPGHEVSHMALFHKSSGTLFSGDLIGKSAHFNPAPLSSSIADYEESLKRVRDLSPQLIVPAHGDVIDNPVEHVNECLANVQDMKGRILDVLEKCPEATSAEIANEIFKGSDPMKAGIQNALVLLYLERLNEEGAGCSNRGQAHS